MLGLWIRSWFSKGISNRQWEGHLAPSEKKTQSQATYLGIILHLFPALFMTIWNEWAFFKFFSVSFKKKNTNLSSFIRPKLILSRRLWKLEKEIRDYHHQLLVQRLGDLKLKTWKEELDHFCAPQIYHSLPPSCLKYTNYVWGFGSSELLRNVPFGSPFLISVGLILSLWLSLNGLRACFISFYDEQSHMAHILWRFMVCQSLG